MSRWRHGMAWLLVAPVWAQQVGAAQPGWLIEPRVMARFSVANNADSSSSVPNTESVIEFVPGIRIQAFTPKARGFLDYSLASYAQIHGTRDEELRHTANGAGQLELIDQWLFVDVNGVISRQAVSAFGAQGLSDTRTLNQARTISGRLSPYLKGELLGGLAYELRYTAAGVNTDDSVRSDSLSQSVSLRLAQSNWGRLGWALSAEHQQVAYRGQQPDASFDSVNGSVTYAITPQVQGELTLGMESNDQISLETETHRALGVGVSWRPSERTRVSARVTDRYFGVAHDFAVEHQMGRSVIRLSDSRSVENTSGLESASLGNVYDLFDALLSGTEPDPIARAKLVEDELRRRGLSANVLVNQSFLLSRATVQRHQQLTWAYRGVRQTLTVGLDRSQVSRVQRQVLTAGDDLDALSSVRSLGLNMTVSHRLTPRSSISASYTQQQNTGSGDSASPRAGSRSLAVAVSTALGPRTAGTLQVRHTRASGDVDVPSETLLSGDLLHRF